MAVFMGCSDSHAREQQGHPLQSHLRFPLGGDLPFALLFLTTFIPNPGLVQFLVEAMKEN